MEHSPSPTPSRAIYGFVLYLFSWIGLVMYLCWAYIPDRWLHKVGIYYYPHKYWAVAVPGVCCLTIVLLVFAYVLNNIRVTKPLHSLDTITDIHAKYLDFDSEDLKSKNILPISDLDICHINNILYD